MNDINVILEARGGTHGSFSDNARTAQLLKEEMKQGRNWNKLSDTMKESLHMIAHKTARILSGDPTVVDHWADISGYAKLVADELSAAKSRANCQRNIEISKDVRPKWMADDEEIIVDIRPELV